MNKLLTIIFVLLLASPLMALDSKITCDTIKMVDSLDGNEITATNSVTITAGTTGYAYLEASMQRSGVFAAQMSITSTAAVDIDVSLEVSLQDYPTEPFYAEWSPADNDATVVNMTTSGAVTAEVQNAKRLRATIPAKLQRVKIENNGSGAVVLLRGVVACW